MLTRVVLLVGLGAAPVLAQSPAGAGPRPDVDYAGSAWREVHGYLLRAARDAPDSLFAYRPTADVRSFGETLDHVAASERGYCQMALGERPAGGGAGTGARTKGEVIAALEAAGAACERAYAQRAEDAAQPAYGGTRTSRLQVLLTNAMHDNEHYGNVVTYLRLNHRVPPSSQAGAR